MIALNMKGHSELTNEIIDEIIIEISPGNYLPGALKTAGGEKKNYE